MQVRISFAAPRICRIVLSLRRERLIVQARFRRLASLVMRKAASDRPLAQRDTLIHLTGARYSKRDHQEPAHHYECDSMANCHAGEISNRGATDKLRKSSDNCGQG